ncbi:MAG: hypothetical protein HY040_02675 [Planctomycetes bacterium]|nr:hypothetical protein [Planctomycetota bacterium]
MSTAGTPLPKELTPQETAALLQRILEAVEKDERSRWVEITCAVVLSLATMSSAWCAYQATLWGGVQTFRLAAATKAGRESSAASLSALQSRAFDASMFISYMQAKHEGNERHEKFLFKRFRPEMKTALEAWLKTDPFNDPNAPLGPFRMAEYAQQELEEAKRHEDRFAQEYAAAQHANENSDTYVLLTTLFATVLFFGGIAGTVDRRRLRITILSIALTLFVVSLVFLATMPICHE